MGKTLLEPEATATINRRWEWFVVYVIRTEEEHLVCTRRCTHEGGRTTGRFDLTPSFAY